MTQNKKHVIPKGKYGRKRREYFHNEEREQRVQQERKARKQREERAEILAKNNEERVKENLRKARIEKLTQEEIQQQQATAAARNSTYSQGETTDQQIPLDDTFNETSKQIDNGDKHATDKQPSKLTVDNQGSGLNQDEPNIQDTPLKKEQEEHFYSENAQQSRVDHYLNDDENKTQPHNPKLEESEQLHQSKSETETKGEQRTTEKVRTFFIEHWAKILIVVAIIVLLILIQAIFKNVDDNGSSNHNAFNDTQDTDKTYTTTMKSANNAIHSVVTVENDTSNDTTSAEKETQEAGKENELGSGVVYKKVGDSIFIMTNAHVVGDKKEQKITYGNDDYSIGKVIGADKYSDIAVVKAKVKSDSDVKPIKMGDSSKLVLGEPIIVVGNPLGVDFKGSISNGIVSGLNRHIPVDIDKDNQYDVLMSAFQMDAPVNPGNSGGAVIDRESKLVGIASLKIDMDNVEGIAFAIPINDAESIAKQLEDKGEVKYPNTGITIANIGDINDSTKQSINLPDDVNKGVFIGEVKKDSLAEKSGLQKNDVIVELDGKELEDNLRYRQIIFSHKDDLKTLPAKIYRDGKEKDIKIKLK
ncbi:S1C family serine protease [Staphylococcus nepalensis]|uniref:S1C family serine protease n=1 Tax=Staphylococcus nepalensis TaxID=214473 RepID=UPI000E059AC9|nr:S1C family serine protease [Staphylococcus nepalensis]MCD8890802.1 S1C family serine protease [Staphylococcus nepalensis]MDR5648975.1 S1C family serine protease [Staphylococcus nepalensis]SUM70228.1 serine protease [Staphylococcus nepalensis]SUM96220.1 serine protease [Staphylococcus nepalensis]